MLANVAIAGLKKSDYGVPFITDTEQLFFNGTETQVHCDRVWATKVRQPIDIERYITDEQLKGNFLPDMLSRPKSSTLQPEGFHGNVAINQYGIDHEMIMAVDNDHLLTIPKLDSFVTNNPAPQLNKTPDITTSIKNALRNPTKISQSTSVLPRAKQPKKTLACPPLREGRKMVMVPLEQYKDVVPKTKLDARHLKEKLDFAIENMDFSILKREGRTTISKKVLRDRIQRTVETLAFQSQDPKFKLDVEAHLRENLDILTGVVAYAQKDPQFKMVLDKVMKEHKAICKMGLEGYGYKKGKATGGSINKNLRDKTSVSVAALISPQCGLKGDLDPGMSSKCFLDDRFVTRDQLEPLTAYAIEPQPMEMPMPSNNRCNNTISF